MCAMIPMLRYSGNATFRKGDEDAFARSRSAWDAETVAASFRMTSDCVIFVVHIMCLFLYECGNY